MARNLCPRPLQIQSKSNPNPVPQAPAAAHCSHSARPVQVLAQLRRRQRLVAPVHHHPLGGEPGLPIRAAALPAASARRLLRARRRGLTSPGQHRKPPALLHGRERDGVHLRPAPDRCAPPKQSTQRSVQDLHTRTGIFRSPHMTCFVVAFDPQTSQQTDPTCLPVFSTGPPFWRGQGSAP